MICSVHVLIIVNDEIHVVNKIMVPTNKSSYLYEYRFSTPFLNWNIKVKTKLTIWVASWQNQQNDCAPNEDSGQIRPVCCALNG